MLEPIAVNYVIQDEGSRGVFDWHLNYRKLELQQGFQIAEDFLLFLQNSSRKLVVMITNWIYGEVNSMNWVLKYGTVMVVMAESMTFLTQEFEDDRKGTDFFVNVGKELIFFVNVSKD